jgi:hypothetical protein
MDLAETKRERVLEALGQRARRGDNQYGGPATVAGPETTADIANGAGVSERTWQNRTKVGRALGPEGNAEE